MMINAVLDYPSLTCKVVRCWVFLTFSRISQVSGDKQGAVFGGLLDGPLKPTAKRKYQVNPYVVTEHNIYYC